MRKSTLLLAIGILTSPLAMAAPPGPVIIQIGQPPPADPVTYKRLDDQDALDTLQRTNPRHYAIARKILAAANEICNATKSEPVAVKFNAEYLQCENSLWMTSNPPKRWLQFRIDDTVYSAHVIATHLHPRLTQTPLKGPQPK